MGSWRICCFGGGGGSSWKLETLDVHLRFGGEGSGLMGKLRYFEYFDAVCVRHDEWWFGMVENLRTSIRREEFLVDKQSCKGSIFFDMLDY